MLSPNVSYSFSPQLGGSSTTPVPENSISKSSELLTPLSEHSEADSGNPSDTMSSFQSAKDRLDRMNGEADCGHSTNSVPLTWRRNTTTTENGVAESLPESGARLVSTLGGEHSIPVSSISPGPVYPSEDQLLVATGYGIRRKDGLYTRLIRADDLQEFNVGIPATQEGPEGLIILPATEPCSRDDLDGPFQYVTRAFVENLQKNCPNRPNLNVPFTSTRTYENQQAMVQLEIDSIVAKNPIGPVVSPSSANKTPRRQKIYCDKWIHDGTCAFTQMGCKYKHEMPMDKVTQMSLGLNHGVPLWYKKANSVQLRPGLQVSPPQSITTGPWRRPDDFGVAVGRGISSNPATAPRSRAPLGRGMSNSPPSASAVTKKNFGPIGRPAPPKYPQTVSSNNPFAALPREGDVTMEDDEDEEGQVTYSGRCP